MTLIKYIEQKPKELCVYNASLESILPGPELKDFIIQKKRSVVSVINSFGYSIRKGETNDIPAIMDLIKTECSPFVADQLKESDIYRCLVYGYLALLEDTQKKLIAFYSTISYADPDKTSFIVYTVVAKIARGNKLAVLARDYCTLTCMQNGQRVAKTWIDTSNFANLKNALNNGGFFCDGFHPHLYLPNNPRLTFTLYLTPSGLFNNNISDSKLYDFLSDKSKKDSYRLINCSDLDGLHNCYEENKFKIIAFVSGKITQKENALLAISNSLISTKPYEKVATN